MSLAERLGLLILGLLLFLPGIGGRDLWNPDEPRYAEVAREMRLSGDFLVPHLNGQVYSEKPPLLFWLIAASSFATGGVDEVSARLPSLVAAITALFFLFGLARRLFDRRLAWVAVLVFATSGRILWQARVGQIDMLLLACVTAAMYFFARGWLEHRRGFYRLFFVAAGLGTLAKGPVGLLPPLLSALLFVWLSGERRRWREIGVLSGLAIWAGVVLLWFVPAAIAGGSGYLETLLFKQNVRRFADPWGHRQPFYYFLGTVPADFFPWSIFLPGAFFLGLRRSTGDERRGYLFALAWIVATVFFFSLSPGKRTVYVLPMFPALALVVALFFCEIARSGERLRRWVTLPSALLALLFGIVPLLLPRLAERQADLVAMLGPSVLIWVGGLAATLAAAALVAYAAAARARPVAAATALAVGMGLAAALASTVLLPRLQPVKSFRPIAERFAALAAPDEPVASFPRLEPPLVFYSRRFFEVLTSETELAAYVSRPGRVWLFVERDELARVAPGLGLVPIAETVDREKSYVLFASSPPGAAASAPPESSAGRAQVF